MEAPWDLHMLLRQKEITGGRTVHKALSMIHGWLVIREELKVYFGCVRVWRKRTRERLEA